jgi:hypothetical protein
MYIHEQRCRATAGNLGRVATLARALAEIEQTIAQLADESRSPVPRNPGTPATDGSALRSSVERARTN